MAKKAGAQRKYSIEKWGVMGKFETQQSLPIEFLLTSFAISELEEKLTFANKVDAEKRDFELLMQRDIDMDRVERAIMKYINPDRTQGELLSRPVFFPPLLVAVIPTTGTKIAPSLPDLTTEVGPREAGDTTPFLKRSWGDIFRVSYFPSDPDKFQGPTFTTDDGQSVIVDSTPVCLEALESKDMANFLGIRLVVFDGQHRLMALIKLAKAQVQLDGISVPVAIVWSPNSTTAIQQKSPAKYRAVHEVFRRLFVDVNKNAVAVGGHFNTLLADSDVGSAAMRIFCEQVLEKYTETGLALVEWNIRSKKDATQIRRDYSLTSIGVLDLALRKGLSGRKLAGLLKHVLALGQIEDLLYPVDANYEYPKPIEYEKFSPAQRVILESAIRDRLINQGLIRIFFETDQFIEGRKAFEEVIQEYRDIAEKQTTGYESCHAILKLVLDYRPYEVGNAGFMDRERKFSMSVRAKYESRINGIIRYSVFQRSMVDAWLRLIDKFRDVGSVDIQELTTAYIGLLNHALNREAGLFSETLHPYMMHSVFRAKGKIKPTDATRQALTHLILACLCNTKVASKFLRDLSLEHEQSWKDAIIKIGVESATSFAGHLRKERIRDFVNSYPTDFSIAPTDREELTEAHSRMDDLKTAVRNNQASKQELTEATKQFEQLIDHYVGHELEQAIDELRVALGSTTAIVFNTHIEDEEPEEELNGN